MPSHCIDAWSYFGRAAQALMRGDTGACRHLAYYAELRAVLAILGRNGIGILRRDHYVIDGAGSAVPLHWRLGTHEAAADILAEWSTLPASESFLSTVVRPGQERLGEWIDQFPVGTSLAAVAQQRFREWGVDLTALARDRDARNEASYRPRHLAARRHLHPRRAARHVEAIWELLKPEGTRYFEALDRALLRSTLEVVYERGTGVPPGTSARYKQMVVDTVDVVVGPAALRPRILSDLTCEPRPHGIVLEQVGGQASPGSPSFELQMLARAVVLLRLATGAMRDLVDELGLDATQLQAWWGRIGADLALWPAPPLDVFDLWADVVPAIETLAAWRQTNPERYSQLRESCGEAQVTLSQTELVPMWALA